MNLQAGPVSSGIRHPWETPPPPGEAIEVAEGILWARLPLPMALDHVNIYFLDDGDSWTLVDTGLNWKPGREQMEALLAGPARGKPVARVLMTHSHPDHIGLVGMFAERGAEVLASRAAWLLSRMLILDRYDAHPEPDILFRNRAGVTGAALAAFAQEPPFNFADCVAPIPIGYSRLEEGDIFRAAGRDWTIRTGEGHAVEHLTLWTDEILISGDQVLPGISPNIGVYPSEPEGDPLRGWLDSCARFRALGADPLVLPGHKLPFEGLNNRLDLLIDNHLSAFERITQRLREGPASAVDLMPAIFHRELKGGAFGMGLVEAVAHVNHLYQAGRIDRRLNAEGVWLYSNSSQ